jgi:hypothetical protein
MVIVDHSTQRPLAQLQAAAQLQPILEHSMGITRNSDSQPVAVTSVPDEQRWRPPAAMTSWRKPLQALPTSFSATADRFLYPGGIIACLIATPCHFCCLCSHHTSLPTLKDHERVISIEDMMTSVELDYTDNPALVVPSYTHQVCWALGVLTPPPYQHARL